MFPGGSCAIGRDVYALKPSEELNFSFFHREIQYQVANLIKNARGDIPGLSKEHILSHDIRVPPVAEQRRIVEKVDRLQSRSTRARDELGPIPRLIERYKQAVLTKAVCGELTRDLEIPKSEQAEFFACERYFAGRRRAYLGARRGARLADENRPVSYFEENGKPRMQVQLSDVAELLAGYAFKSKWYSTIGPKLVRGANVAPQCIDWDDERRLTAEMEGEFSQYKLEEGDIVLAMDRPVISSGLKIAVIEKEDEGALLVQRVARIRAVDGVDQSYLWVFLNSPIFLKHLTVKATGMDLPHISANDILAAEFILPPKSEQIEIARRVKRAFSWIDRIAAEQKNAAVLLAKLDQAILAKAFRGELVPQDPDDEPASVLLERIRAERANQPKPKRGRKKTAEVAS
jgi:type I restriction enzyme S subunit